MDCAIVCRRLMGAFLNKSITSCTSIPFFCRAWMNARCSSFIPSTSNCLCNPYDPWFSLPGVCMRMVVAYMYSAK